MSNDETTTVIINCKAAMEDALDCLGNEHALPYDTIQALNEAVKDCERYLKDLRPG